MPEIIFKEYVPTWEEPESPQSEGQIRVDRADLEVWSRMFKTSAQLHRENGDDAMAGICEQTAEQIDEFYLDNVLRIVKMPTAPQQQQQPVQEEEEKHE